MEIRGCKHLRCGKVLKARALSLHDYCSHEIERTLENSLAKVLITVKTWLWCTIRDISGDRNMSAMIAEWLRQGIVIECHTILGYMKGLKLSISVVLAWFSNNWVGLYHLWYDVPSNGRRIPGLYIKSATQSSYVSLLITPNERLYTLGRVKNAYQCLLAGPYPGVGGVRSVGWPTPSRFSGPGFVIW